MADFDDGIELSDLELFDISDIEIEVQRTKGMCKLYVVMKSDSPINLMRFYLSLKEYLYSIENEIGVLPEDFETH